MMFVRNRFFSVAVRLLAAPLSPFHDDVGNLRGVPCRRIRIATLDRVQ